MAAVRKLDIKNSILERSRALGNTKTGFKEVCSDLVNKYLMEGGKVQTLCDGTFLSAVTIDRIKTLKECESGTEYRPNADTCERIFRFFGAEVTFSQVSIKGQYANKEKPKSE